MLMALRVKAEDLRHKIITKMAATVSMTPPTMADNIATKSKLSVKVHSSELSDSALKIAGLP